MIGIGGAAWTMAPIWAAFGSGSGPRVLLVEDEVAIADMYRRQLETDGMSVTIVGDGLSAITAIRGGEWDIVLLDVRLPRMDGFGVLRSVSDELTTLPPVLILSNYGDVSMIREGLSLGATDYLVKSATTPGELSLRVRALAGREGPLGNA